MGGYPLIHVDKGDAKKHKGKKGGMDRVKEVVLLKAAQLNLVFTTPYVFSVVVIAHPAEKMEGCGH